MFQEEGIRRGGREKRYRKARVQIRTLELQWCSDRHFKMKVASGNMALCCTLNTPQLSLAHSPGETSGRLATQKLGQGLQWWSVGHFLQYANIPAQPGWDTSPLGGVRQFTALPGGGLTFPPPHTYVPKALKTSIFSVSDTTTRILCKDKFAPVFSGQVLKQKRRADVTLILL